MKTMFAVLLGVSFFANAVLAETVEVPGTANPWLAGMTNGATARRGDGAPGESPVLIAEIEGHATYTFCVSGAVNHGSPLPFSGPNGEDLISHYLGAENGIADLAAPFASLIGVFLGPDEPDQTPAPTRLDFSVPADRNYAELAPALKQPFFIGGGLTSSGEVQQIIAPIGATRLFLGVMDEYRWADNEGTFVVKVTKVTPADAIQLSPHSSLGTTDIVTSSARKITSPASTGSGVHVDSPRNHSRGFNHAPIFLPGAFP